MIKILANDGIGADGKLLLEDAGYEVNTNTIAQSDLPQSLPAYDAVIVRSATKIRKELIDVCPNLKIIARGGVGMDNIDVEYARSKGIKVINTPAASSRSVAELAFGHMLSLGRSLHQANRSMPVKGGTEFKALKKAYAGGFELQGRTLGILGFGRIGQETARVALGMGMKVLPVDLYINEATISIDLFEMDQASLRVKLTSVDLDTMLANSDIITTHVPFSGDKPLLGKEEIAKMKDGVILINTARGGIIGEEALLEGLESGKVRGAALDVFNNEPTPNPALLTHPNISLSPHIGAATGEAQSNIGKELADQIIAVFDK
jgi:D-3-phosphoglycerate dehydrogenase